MFRSTISVLDSDSLTSLFGARDQHLRKIRDVLNVSIALSGDEIRVEGEETVVAQATEVLTELNKLVQRHGSFEPEEVTRLLASVRGEPAPPNSPELGVLAGGKKLAPRTAGQARYLRAIHECELVFCVGPAGCGKTYLAVASAVAALKRHEVRKIVLVRPAVEAGENLGYLPGDLQAKINPYLRPLLDALQEMMDSDQLKKYSEQDIIEVIPLAYMRGRTLNNSFIILDEAQNATTAQMKMFLTRMGHESKIVVSGDVTQVDLPRHSSSGLIDAIARLQKIKGVARVELTAEDIVRHRLVTEIVQAYEEKSKKRR